MATSSNSSSLLRLLATPGPCCRRRTRIRSLGLAGWPLLLLLLLSPLLRVDAAQAAAAAPPAAAAEPTSTHQADVEALVRFKAAVRNAPDTILAEWRPGETDPCGLGEQQQQKAGWPGVVCRCGDLSAALVTCGSPPPPLLLLLPPAAAPPPAAGGSSSTTASSTTESIWLSPSGLAVSAAGPLSSLAAGATTTSALRARVVGLDLGRPVAGGGRGLAPLAGPAAAALDLRLLEALVYLDLSQNALEGPLPDLTGDAAPGLQWLIVAGNGRLNGSLPAALGGGGGRGGGGAGGGVGGDGLLPTRRAALKGALLAGNDFEGEVPEAWCASSATFEVQGNPRLCGA
jgi:hypothetical protein